MKVLGRTLLNVSELGFGTYRITRSSEHPEHGEALRQALLSGINLIDTSTNYGDGVAELAISDVITPLFRGGQLDRKNLVVVSKAGYVQGANMEVARGRMERGSPFPEMVRFSPECWHCIHPQFLEMQITSSLDRLGLEYLDVFLLHNPEYFLRTQPDTAEYYRRLTEACVYLEKEVARGRIRWYGISSNTFVQPKEDPAFTSLEMVLEHLEKVVPQHHFGVIQCPLNLFEPGALLEPNHSGQSVLSFAKSRNIGTLINRPLNAIHEGRLYRLADFTGQDVLPDTLQSAFEHVLQLESHYEGEALVPPDRLLWAHILQKNIEKLPGIEGWREFLEHQIRPSIAQGLATLLKDPHLAAWAEEFRFRMDELLASLTQALESFANRRSKAIRTTMDTIAPELLGVKALSQKSLATLLALPEVDSALVGMRHTRYVTDAQAALAVSPTLKPEQARALLLGVAREAQQITSL